MHEMPLNPTRKHTFLLAFNPTTETDGHEKWCKLLLLLPLWHSSKTNKIQWSSKFLRTLCSLSRASEEKQQQIAGWKVVASFASVASFMRDDGILYVIDIAMWDQKGFV